MAPSNYIAASMRSQRKSRWWRGSYNGGEGGVMDTQELVRILEIHNNSLAKMNDMLQRIGVRLDTLTYALDQANIPAVAACEDEGLMIQRMTAAMREADRDFEQVGGSTRHHVRDCLLPILSKHGLRLVCEKAEAE